MSRLLYKKIKYFGFKYKCEVCNCNIRKYFKFSDSIENNAKKNGFEYSFHEMETLNYYNCNCPICLSTDRERLYLLYFKKFIFKHLSKQQLQSYKILDFAPSPIFVSAIKSFGVYYQTADLYKEEVDLKIDICQMDSIEDDTYDFIICSHILEHVENPAKAVSEIKRILKSTGKAIIMVPIFHKVKNTIEDKQYNTEELRWKHYGQGDHVRLFSKDDFVKLIIDSGLNLKEINTTSFDEKELSLNAISANSILYVCSK